VVDPPECPRPAPIANGTIYPRCLGGDCNTWGPQKLYDFRESGLRSLGEAEYSTDPYFQLDMGVQRGDVQAVRVVARSDAYIWESNNIDVYIGPTTSFLYGAATPCAYNVTFPALGAAVTVLCPVNTTARYITVQHNGTAYFSLQEVSALVDSKLERGPSALFCTPCLLGGAMRPRCTWPWC
jgi:hypothetical protein